MEGDFAGYQSLQIHCLLTHSLCFLNLFRVVQAHIIISYSCCSCSKDEMSEDVHFCSCNPFQQSSNLFF